MYAVTDRGGVKKNLGPIKKGEEITTLATSLSRVQIGGQRDPADPQEREKGL